MIAQLAKLRGRSIDELRQRTLQKLRAAGERMWLALGRTSPAAPALAPDERTWLAQRSGFGALAGRSPADIARAIADGDPAWAARVRATSRSIAAGRVPLLGFPPFPVGDPPAWHRDPATGVEAPQRHWSRIDYLDPRIVGDHKTLWELSRHQYLFAPACAWLLDGDADALRRVFAHLASWLDANPRHIGVHWASSLEVAYRGISWCWLLWLLRDADWPRGLLPRLVQSLAWHARHVERYLSTYFSPNTHLTGEALGLFYIGTVLDDLPEAQRWRAQGAAILERVVDTHVLADGVYFERASQYQRYTVEIYLHYDLLARATAFPVAPQVRAAIVRAADVLRAIATAGGTMPLLGDDDGGALLPIDLEPPHALAGLLQLLARALERPDLAPRAAPAPALAAWLLGPAQEATAPAAPEWLDLHCAIGGLVVLRDGWQGDDAVATLDAGAHGALSHGHSHADALALTLALGERELFVDRGTATYVGAARDDYRCTSAHNTLEFDGESSARPAGPFRWAAVPPAATASLCTGPGIVAVQARTTGHVDSGTPSQHARWVVHPRRGAWLVLDRGTRRPDSRAVLRWQLAPGIAARAHAPHHYTLVGGEGDATAGAALADVLLLGNGHASCRPRSTSPRFGAECPAEVLEYALGPGLQAITLVIPAGTHRQYEAPRTDGSEGSGLHWTDADGRHRLTCPVGSEVAAGPDGWHVRAVAAWWTAAAGDRSATWTPDRLIVIHPIELRPPGETDDLIARQGIAPDILVLARDGATWRTAPLVPVAPRHTTRA